MITEELKELVETCKGLGLTQEEMLFLVEDREKFDKIYEAKISNFLAKIKEEK